MTAVVDEEQGVCQQIFKIWPGAKVCSPSVIGLAGHIVSLKIECGVVLHVRQLRSNGALWYLMEFSFIEGLFWKRRKVFIGSLSCDSQTGIIERLFHTDKSRFDELVNRWILPFSRSCYLSGFPIEHSAHEAIEWGPTMKEFQRCPTNKL